MLCLISNANERSPLILRSRGDIAFQSVLYASILNVLQLNLFMDSVEGPLFCFLIKCKMKDQRIVPKYIWTPAPTSPSTASMDNSTVSQSVSLGTLIPKGFLIQRLRGQLRLERAAHPWRPQCVLVQERLWEVQRKEACSTRPHPRLPRTRSTFCFIFFYVRTVYIL